MATRILIDFDLEAQFSENPSKASFAIQKLIKFPLELKIALIGKSYRRSKKMLIKQ